MAVSSKKLFAAAAIIFCFGFPLALAAYANYLDVAPSGSEGVLFSAMLFLILLLFLSAAVLVGGIIGLCFQKTRAWAVCGIVCAVVYFFGFAIGGRIGAKIRMQGFPQLPKRSAPLVQAIKNYESKYGHPPSSLGGLVPEFIPVVPSTGMGAYPKYEYVTGEKAAGFDGNPWVLFVHTSPGGINFDQFMYFPLQNYPERGYGGWLEKLDDWAYVHE